MGFNEYQKKAMTFARYADRLYPFMALAEEAGEVMGKIAKFTRKEGHTPSFYPSTEAELTLSKDLEKELGDVLWQVQACCKELGITLEQLAESNLAKLSGRAERGTIVGEGDAR